VGLALFNGPYPLKPHRVSYPSVRGLVRDLFYCNTTGPTSGNLMALTRKDMLVRRANLTELSCRPPAVLLWSGRLRRGPAAMRGGEFIRLATPRPLYVTVGGTRARVLARARVPRGGRPGPARIGQTRPRPLFPSPSSAPPHPDLRMRRGICYWVGGSGVSQEGRLPSRPR